MNADPERNEHWRWVGPTLRRLSIRNFRNIGRCDVGLAPLSVVVGRNGAGKSNLLDGIAFVSDAVRGSLEEAVRDRGGIDAVRRRSTGHPRTVRFALELRLPSWCLAHYAFQLVTQPNGTWTVVAERATIRDDGNSVLGSFHRSEDTLLRTSLKTAPPAEREHLYLTRAAAFEPFRELYDTLASMRVYRFERGALRGLPSPTNGLALHHDGANLPSVIARLTRDDPETLQRVTDYLGAIVPGTIGVERVAAGPRETLQFRQKMAGSRHPWRLHGVDMADGTLATLATLVAAFQDTRRTGAISLVGLESPEHGLHPLALGALVEALGEAARNTQLMIATHSPELLDALRPERDVLLAVAARGGTAVVAPANVEPGPGAGEHLRHDSLKPLRRGTTKPDQLGLFQAGGG